MLNSLTMWTKLTTPILVKAKYSLQSPPKEQCLSLVIGDILIATQEYGEWYFGHSFLNGMPERSGIFPKSYILRISENQRDSVSSCDYATEMKQRMQSEIVETLHEWLPTWREVLVRNPAEGQRVTSLIGDLISIYVNDISDSQTSKHLEMTNKRLIVKIDFGNELLKHDLIPRRNDNRIGLSQLSFVELYDIYEETAKRSNNATHRGSIRDPSRLLSPAVPYRLQMNVTNYDMQVGEQEMVWTLRDKSTKRPLFEPSRQITQSNSISSQSESIDICFEELYLDDDEKELILQVVIYRRGNILPDLNKKCEAPFRRPIGMASLSLKRVDLMSEKVYSMRIVPFYESELPKFIPNTMRRQQSVTSLSGIRKIDVRIEAIPLNEAKSRCKYMCYRALLKAGRRAVLDRDRLFVELICGEYEKANKTSAKNVEVRISLRGANGKCLGLIENSDQPYFFVSSVLYHNNSPEWRELMQVNLQQQDTENLHLLFEFYHCTTRDKRNDERNLFGYSVYHLHDLRRGGISVGRHQLSIQKAENLKEVQYDDYMCHDFIVSDATSERNGNGWRDTVTIQVNVSSTVRTRNDRLNHLLKLSHLDAPQLADFLNWARKILPEDFGKPELMRKIFFMIMEQMTYREDENVQMNIFLTLLEIIHQMEESALELKELEFVISQSAEISVKRLMNQMSIALKNLYENHLSIENETILLQSLTTLLSLISDSFSDISRRSSIYMFAPMSLDICLQIIESQQDHLMDIKEMMWKEYAKMLKVLAVKILPEEMTVRYSQNFIELALRYNENDAPLMTVVTAVDILTKIEKLYVHNFFTTFDLLRRFIYEISQPKWDCFSLGLTLWCNIFQNWKNVSEEEQQRLREPLLTILLPRFLSDINRLPSTQVKAKNRITAVLCNLLKILFSEDNALSLSMKSNHPIWKITCQRIFSALELLSEKIKFPEHWFTIKLERSRITLNSLISTANFLFEIHCVDEKLWRSYFTCSSTFIQQDCLQLHTFKTYKRHKIMETFGDLRVLMVNHMLDTWRCLEKDKLNFCEGKFDVLELTVGKILPLTLIPENGLRTKFLALFCGFLHECCKIKDFKQVSSRVCDVLEGLLQQGLGDAEFLLELKRTELGLQKFGYEETTLMNKLTHLIQTHLELRTIMQHFQSRIKRILCLSKLMTFYQEEIPINSREIHYMQQLIDIYVESNIYLEAALLMKMKAERIPWSIKVVPKSSQSPPYFYERQKEACYWRALELFQKCNVWELALDICHELAEFYRSQLKYELLCHILRMQTDFYQSIVQEERLSVSYYCMRFLCKTLPSYLQTGLFIHRAGAFSEINAFQHQLKEDFPDYEFLNFSQYTTKQQEMVEQSLSEDEKYIVFLKVKAIPHFPSMLSEPSIPVPQYVRQFYENNCTMEFSSDRPFHKGARDPSNEMKTLHIERSIFRAKHSLPCGFTWSPVHMEETISLTPLEVAIEAIATKCQDLTQLTQLHRQNESADLRLLTMLLLGVLDAAVNGGIALYMKAFFNEEFIQSNPSHAKDLETLKNQFKTLLQILEDGLAVHEAKANSEIQLLHQRLLECFQVMRHNVEKLDDVNMAACLSDEEQRLPMHEVYEKLEEVYGSASGSVEGRSRGNTLEDLLSRSQSRRTSRANSTLPDPKSALDALSSAIHTGMSPDDLFLDENEETNSASTGSNFKNISELSYSEPKKSFEDESISFRSTHSASRSGTEYSANSSSSFGNNVFQSFTELNRVEEETFNVTLTSNTNVGHHIVSQTHTLRSPPPLPRHNSTSPNETDFQCPPLPPRRTTSRVVSNFLPGSLPQSPSAATPSIPSLSRGESSDSSHPLQKKGNSFDVPMPYGSHSSLMSGTSSIIVSSGEHTWSGFGSLKDSDYYSLPYEGDDGQKKEVPKQPNPHLATTEELINFSLTVDNIQEECDLLED